MSFVATYLNFAGTTAAAFEYYKSVFGTDYSGEVMRLGDIPPMPDGPELSDADKAMVMHVSLPILGGHLLMGTDVTESTGAAGLVAGNNVHIMLGPDTKADADNLWAKLADGGTNLEPMRDEFWGDYYGSCTDQFGIGWMLNVVAAASSPSSS